MCRDLGGLCSEHVLFPSRITEVSKRAALRSPTAGLQLLLATVVSKTHLWAAVQVSWEQQAQSLLP